MANVQVVVRCRGRNERETIANSKVVVELPNQKFTDDDAYVIVSNQHGMKQTDETKTYKVDQVYGSQADQRDIFERVALPLYHDFMNGYNVTILSYGQTGTGKTYTMCGEIENAANKDILTDKAGIIPRVLRQIFQTLSKQDDYVVKCSHIELYNEELKDLLADDDDKKLRLYENSGKTVIQNLTYDHIPNFATAFDLLKRGLAKRKTASTRINDVSSRSHAIFTILLYRQSAEGKYLFSKMNLVDLAGSENISKSGAINQRAKEAGSINQSLLTLGRVINSLSVSTSSSHVPYRESKLTRLLQDSLGGSTKTALITTISPAKLNVEETISALDYACKAKNIKNLPQSGRESEIFLKRTLVKSLSSEIATKNLDLIAARSKNGIYISEENYSQLTEDNASLKTELTEAKLLIELLTAKGEDFEMFKHKNDIIREDLLEKIDQLDQEFKGTSVELDRALAKNKMLNHDIGELNSVNDQVTKKLKVAENESTTMKTQLEMKSKQIQDKNEEIFKLNENMLQSQSKIELLTKLINDHAEQSHSTVKSILNKVLRQTEDSCELVDSYNSALTHTVELFKSAIINNVESIKTDWYDHSSTELKTAFANFNQVYQQLGSFFEGTMISLQEDIADSGLMKFEFTMNGKLAEKHKAKLERERLEFKKNALEALVTVLADYDSKVHSLSTECMSNFGNELVNSENKKLREEQQNSMEDISKIIKSAEQIGGITKPEIDSKILKLNDLKAKSVLSIEDLKVPETITIRDRLNDDAVPNSLKDLSETLQSLKNNHAKLESQTTADPKNMGSMTLINTPIHEYSKSISPIHMSPIRTSPNKSKIPKHIISAEMSSNRKRRKVLESADMLLNRSNN